MRYHPKGGAGQNQCRARRRGSGDERGSVVDHRDLDRAVRARLRRGRAEAPHHVLPPAARAIVPDRVTGRSEKAVRRKLGLIDAIARRGYEKKRADTLGSTWQA